MTTPFRFFLRWMLTGLLLVSSSIFLQGKALSPRISKYTISVTLHPDTKILDVHMILDWKNPSLDTIH